MIDSDRVLNTLQYIYLVDGAGAVPSVTKYFNGFTFTFNTMGRRFNITLDTEYNDIEISASVGTYKTRLFHEEENIENMEPEEIARLAWDWVVDFQKVCTLFEDNADNIW